MNTLFQKMKGIRTMGHTTDLSIVDLILLLQGHIGESWLSTDST